HDGSHVQPRALVCSLVRGDLRDAPLARCVSVAGHYPPRRGFWPDSAGALVERAFPDRRAAVRARPIWRPLAARGHVLAPADPGRRGDCTRAPHVLAAAILLEGHDGSLAL